VPLRVSRVVGPGWFCFSFPFAPPQKGGERDAARASPPIRLFVYSTYTNAQHSAVSSDKSLLLLLLYYCRSRRRRRRWCERTAPANNGKRFTPPRNVQYHIIIIIIIINTAPTSQIDTYDRYIIMLYNTATETRHLQCIVYRAVNFCGFEKFLQSVISVLAENPGEALRRRRCIIDAGCVETKRYLSRKRRMVSALYLMVLYFFLILNSVLVCIVIRLSEYF